MPGLPIYLDHAATTPVSPEVLAAMEPYFTELYGNASSAHVAGIAAREAVEDARSAVAKVLGADAEEVFFTSGGTEADNWALKGSARADGGRRTHVLVSAIEHHAVLAAAESLRVSGYTVDRVPVNSAGIVEPSEVAARISNKTLLVSVMHANNEVGTVQPVEAIGRVCKERGVVFHVDAVQSFGQIPVDVRPMYADLVSVSGHKIYGPKGVGALYIRRGLAHAPLLDGGGQEHGLRGGTLNVPAIVGFAEAARQAASRMPDDAVRAAALRDRLIEQVTTSVRSVFLTGSTDRRLPNNAHFCVPGVEGEALLLALDAAGICASAGAACSTGTVEPSHVLLAMGIARDVARGAVRMTVGRSTTAEDVDYAANELRCAVESLMGIGARHRASAT